MVCSIESMLVADIAAIARGTWRAGEPPYACFYSKGLAMAISNSSVHGMRLIKQAGRVG